MTCHFYIITYFSNCVWSLFMWPNRDGKWEGVERRGVGWGGGISKAATSMSAKAASYTKRAK